MLHSRALATAEVVMADRGASQSCWLLSLPDELKLHITDYLYRKRDLYNISLTCRTLEDMVTRRLYAKVDIGLPRDGHSFSARGEHHILRPHVVRALRELSIGNGDTNVKSSAGSCSGISDGKLVDGHVRQVINNVPQDQLKSFSYLHHTPLSLDTLDVLASRHATGLQELSFFEVDQFKHTDAVVPEHLTALQCRSVLDGEAITPLVQANQSTLKRLSLGQERQLVEQYRRTRFGFLEQIPQLLELFRRGIQLQSLPNLRHLDLCGLDVTPLVPASFEDAAPFLRLTRLSLESCTGSRELLDSLAGTFHFVQNAPDAPQPRMVPQLTKFLFRSEAPTTALKESMIRFLASFRGLKTLSLLFENATMLDSASTMIAEHGPTLETLVLESRIQPRENLGLDTSRPFGVGGYSSDLWEESISDICRLCPNLVELGTGFPWNDEIVRLRKTPLPTLRNLRTIHIRNFPESHVLSQLGDYTIKEYATKFIEWVFPALVGASRPNLETLAIGPTLYESRWKSNGTRKQPPEFARTHHYCLDWAKTRFGRWSPMITPVSEKCIEELRDEKPLGGVFEQVWLR